MQDNPVPMQFSRLRRRFEDEKIQGTLNVNLGH